MQGFPSKAGGSLSLSVELRVDAACQRFEAAYRADQTPRIDDYLGEAAGAERRTLLKELILVDVHHRRRRGEAVLSADYIARFPDLDPAWLDGAMAARPPAAARDAAYESGPSPEADAPSLHIPGYDILGELGRGGMGVVYKARQARADRLVALKMVLTGEPARLRTEAEAAARLQHPNIVQVFEVGEHDGKPFFSLELCPGGNLERKLNGAPLPAADAARLVETLARAVHAAHRQDVVHRDLKPANVLLTEDGTPKITDFGLAKKLEVQDGQTLSGVILGTPSYMAPEQAKGRGHEAGPAADIYALGAILYECLTGRPPFKGPTVLETLELVCTADPVPVRRLQPRLPRDLETICLKCLQKQPAQRYATAAALAEDLRRFIAGEPIRARPVGALERTWRWSKRRPSQAVLVAALMLIVVAAVAGTVWYYQDRADRAAADGRAALERARKAANTERDVAAALEEATAYARQAAGLHEDPGRWEAALVAALSAGKRADGVLNNGVDDTGELRTHVNAVRAELESADRDRRTIARVEDARMQMLGGNDEGDAEAAAHYAAAFEEDMKLSALSVDEAADRVSRRAVREELLLALGDWEQVAPKDAEKVRLHAIVDAVDPDLNSLRKRWSSLLDQRDGEGLRRLAASPEGTRLPTAHLAKIALALDKRGGATEAVKLLKEVNERRPSDFWINYAIGGILYHTKPVALDEAILYFTVAQTLRPRCTMTHAALGSLFYSKGLMDESVAEYGKAATLAPEEARIHYNLALALRGKGLSDEAIAEYRSALHIRPDYANAHINLGNILLDKRLWDEAIVEYRGVLQSHPDAAVHQNLALALSSKQLWDEAITEYREALKTCPDDASIHNNLGFACLNKGESDEAIAECRIAVKLEPENAEAHQNIGIAFYDKHLWEEAITEFQIALQIQPDLAQAWCMLGQCLRVQGRFAESLAAFRRGDRLGGRRPGWSYSSPQWVREAEDLVERDILLPAILRGEAAPADADQQVRFAAFCQMHKKLNETAARFYCEAFRRDPSLADRPNGDRYNAACAAALAGCAQGEDAQTLDAGRRARWRNQALDWLRADLALMTRTITDGAREARTAAAKRLLHWQEDSDLAGVRGDEALAKLPPDEQAKWRRFWADVDAALTMARRS